VRTTKVKAKAAQSFVESVITKAKTDTPASKRHVFALIRDKALIDTLFNDIAPRFKERAGGYTRVIPLYPRRGDGSAMAILELVVKKPKPETKKAKKTAKRPETEPPRKEDKQKTAKKAKKEVPPKPAEEKKETKAKPAPPPKADVRDEIRKEKAKDEEKKIKKGGIFKNIRRYFRGKSE
jgi:large subunit ribosomal protein L17